MLEVWHGLRPTFGMKGLGPEPKFPEDFRKVAEVDREDLDEAFELTNSIDGYWGENDGVKVIMYIGEIYRSTSVGDVVIDSGGRKYLCAGCGWEEMKDA